MNHKDGDKTEVKESSGYRDFTKTKYSRKTTETFWNPHTRSASKRITEKTQICGWTMKPWIARWRN